MFLLTGQIWIIAKLDMSISCLVPLTAAALGRREGAGEAYFFCDMPVETRHSGHVIVSFYRLQKFTLVCIRLQ